MHRVKCSERLNESCRTPPTTSTLGLLAWRELDPQHPHARTFGTPSYPSPLDRLRPKVSSPAPWCNASFSHLPRDPHRLTPATLHHTISATRLTAMPGDGLHSFSFSPGVAKGSFYNPPCHKPGTPGHWLFRSFVGGGGEGASKLPTSILNPNKAVLTIDSTTRILTANDMCSLLLGEAEERLCGGSLKLTDFISCPTTLRHLACLAPDAFSYLEEMTATSPVPEVASEREAVVFSGRVVIIETADSGSQLCSLWLKGLPREAGQEQRWVAVLEPVEITHAKVTVDYSGTILQHDETFRSLFGFHETMLINHQENICDLIPGLQIPPPSTSSSPLLLQEIEQQHCTGLGLEHNSFPLCVQLNPHPTLATQQHPAALDLEISVFSSIGGLVVLDYIGNIIDYNYNFSNLLFGYGRGELNGRNITQLIPSFYEDMTQMQDFSCDEETHTGSYSHQEKEEYNIQKENEEIEIVEKLPQSSIVQHTKQSKKSTSSSNKSSKNHSITTTTATSAAQHSQAMRDVTNSLNCINLKLSHQQEQYQFKEQCNAWKDKCPEGDMELPSLLTSTPASKCRPLLPPPPQEPIEEGTYFGTGRHKDGSSLKLIYQVRCMVVETEAEEEENLGDGGGGRGATYYYLWILKEGITDDASLSPTLDLTPTPYYDAAELSLGHAITREAREPKQDQQESQQQQEREEEEQGDETVNSSYCRSITSSSSECGEEHSHTCTDGSSGAEYSLNHSRRGGRHHSSAVDGEREQQEDGEYSQHYRVLKQIGKGAFGCVKLSYRYSDGLLVVTKFIKKSKVYRDSWVDDMVLGRRVPLEVSLLMSLDHPNIVSVMDMFENEEYFQLVMEKLGTGMDLFEFIDRNPILDEFLAAHIFRQIVAALTYLHSLNIVHRDVKDENVIMDNQFHVKLIDFGSCAFTSPGKEFSQFAGTVEYCSPEVLMGNKYTGYEVEVWSLGVTLYTLMYRENPFYDVDETIKGVLSFPYEYSKDLTSLLKGMMEKKVSARLTLSQVEEHPWTQLPCDPEEYIFHHVVPCTKRERNPKHYLREYSQSGDDNSASICASPHTFQEDVSPYPMVSLIPTTRRANSATTPRTPGHPSKNRDRWWSATPLSMCPGRAAGFKNSEEDQEPCHTPSRHSTSTHSRASTTHSLSSLRSTITVDSASFSACSPHSTSSTTSPSSVSSSTPNTATASDWARTQLKSTCVSSTCQDSSMPLSDSTSLTDSTSSSEIPSSSSHLLPLPRASMPSDPLQHRRGEGFYRDKKGSSAGAVEAPCSTRETSNASDLVNTTLFRQWREIQPGSLTSFSSSSSSSTYFSSSSSSSSHSSSKNSPRRIPQSSSDLGFFSDPISLSDLLSLTDPDLPDPSDSIWDEFMPDSPP